ncbi:hypothetical protein CASFOL_012084 [Castilleja foliolosa]|uniref:NAC domain-containing protein n=1 Tax=Castilleja foliolosa TaxID=1961234 RepID=A0ABD3DRA5_9LAMI
MVAILGFRFKPSDEEKIVYLLRKVTGMLPGNDLIGTRTADLYGEQEPWDIFGDSQEDEQYLFTTLKKVGNKKKKNNDEYKRFTRNVGKGGTWSNKGQKIPILGKRGGLIGHKKCFRYVAKNGDDRINGIWLLKEYTLPDNIAAKNVKVKEEYKDCVLCVLKRKMKKKKNARVGDHDQSPRVESRLVNNNEVFSGSAEMTRVDQSPRVESGLVNNYGVLSGSATNNNFDTFGLENSSSPVDPSPCVESGLVNNNEVFSGSATNNPEMTRVDLSPRVESGLVNNNEVFSGSATNNPEMTRVDMSPRVESGLVNNYEVFSGSATNNNFDNFCPANPVQEIGNYYHHSYYGRGMDIYNSPGLNQENMSNYDEHHVNGDTPEMRAIAKSFVEEEKSYLQMKRSNYENNNIDFLGGCLPGSFLDYLAAADCTPMEFLY